MKLTREQEKQKDNMRKRDRIYKMWADGRTSMSISSRMGCKERYVRHMLKLSREGA